MCESFSAKHMAEDCLKFQGEEELKEIQGENLTPEAPESTTGEKVLGVELLTQAFDSIINRYVNNIIEYYCHSQCNFSLEVSLISYIS